MKKIKRFFVIKFIFLSVIFEIAVLKIKIWLS